MTDAGRQAYNEYMRQWRANNKDKVKQYNQNYWTKRALKQQAEKEKMQGLSSKPKAIRCKDTGELFKSLYDAEKKTGVSRANICRACKGEKPDAGGFQWEYIEITAD